MIEVDKMPESGQFVAVWEHNDKIWATTFKRVTEIGNIGVLTLKEYSPEKDEWVEGWIIPDKPIQYFI